MVTSPAEEFPIVEPGAPGITVTGTRIRRPNLESVVPVTSIQGEQFFEHGSGSVARRVRAPCCDEWSMPMGGLWTAEEGVDAGEVYVIICQ